MSTLKKLIATSAAGLGGALVMTLPASALVQTADIANGAVTTAKLANGAVTTAKLGSDAVHTNNIIDGGVTSNDIKDKTIQNKDIANNTIMGGKIADGTITGADVSSTADLSVNSVSAVALGAERTIATGTAHSHQAIGGDLTYEGNAGGTSSYHAGVMGNFLGDTLTNTTSSYHAGVIGSYNVTTSDANTGASAGVIGEVGDLSVANAAIMAVLGGDGGTLTPDAAYGVQYFNSTAGSHFNYGLDLFHAATTDYGSPSAVDYGVADIRLASGATISSGSSNPGSCVKGSINLNTTDGKLYTCSSTNTWVVTGSQS